MQQVNFVLLRKILISTNKNLFGKDISLWNNLYRNVFCCSAKTPTAEEHDRSLGILRFDFALHNIFLLLKERYSITPSKPLLL